MIMNFNRKNECLCGKEHFFDVEYIYTGENTVSDISIILHEKKYLNVFLVFDDNTIKVLDIYDYLKRLLTENNCIFKTYIYPDTNLIPDETAIGKLITAMPESLDLIIGIGSGVINDLCRFCAYKFKIDYAIITTAASMDGYLSNVSPIIVNGLKTTYIAKPPIAVINEIRLLRTAPRLMTAAGVGDILGKSVCLIDWKLAHLLFNEDYCDSIAKMTADSVKICTDNITEISYASEHGILSIIDSLMLSGAAMSYMGNSRPASGAEHHISHFWEMNFLFENKPPVLHGIKVAVATLSVIQIYQMLLDESPSFEECRKNAENFCFDEYSANIRVLYKNASDAIIDRSMKTNQNHSEKAIQRINIYESNWKAIKETIKLNLPSLKSFTEYLNKAGCPTSPAELGIDRQTYINGIIYAKELRDRFTVLQIASDLGMLTKYAEELSSLYYNY